MHHTLHQARRFARAVGGHATNGTLLVPEIDRPALSAADVGAKKPGSLRLMTLNLGHGRRHLRHQALARSPTLEGNLRAVAHAVRDVEPDVVALQEADGPSTWSGNFDHVARLAELAELPDYYHGEHNVLGVGRFNVRYGTALLSRQELMDPVSRRFGANWRDTKGFVVATLSVPEWGGLDIDVTSVHLDFLTRSVRRRQIASLAEFLAGRRRPLVLSGDLNCCWHFEPESMELLTESLGLKAFCPQAHVPTFPAQRPLRRLDWVLVSPELEFSDYYTLATPLSDHRGVVADLELVTGPRPA